MTSTPPEGATKPIAPQPEATAAQPGRKVIRMNPDILIGLGKRAGIATVGAPIPADARVVHRTIDERGDLVLLIESATFPETREGSRYPLADPITFRSPA